MISPLLNTGCTPIYRAKSHPTELISNYLDRKVENAWDFFVQTARRFPQRRFLGRRFRDEASGQLGLYEWMTYSEAHQIALAFGTTLCNEELIPASTFEDEPYEKGRTMRILGLYAKNCVEWFLAEQACNAFDIALCPLYDTLGEEALHFILEQTRMYTVLTAFDCFDGLLKVLTDVETGGRRAGLNLTTVILIDPECPENSHRTNEQFQEALRKGKPLGLKVFMWHEVVSKGITSLPPAPGGPDSINTICYTSGTTGMPKGVLLPHSTVCAVVIAAGRGPISPSGIFEVGANDCTLSYLPLAHVFERCVCNVVISKGGAIGLYGGDTAKLLDDVKALNPTVFISVPRLFNRINDRIGLTLSEKKVATQLLFNQGLNSKISRRRDDSSTTHRVWDNVVFSKIRAMMGTELRGMICGGAPLDPVVCERITAIFSVPLMQGYGLTESFGPCFLMHPDDPSAGHIGGVWPAVEFRLVSVPELNYLVTDNPPRGELQLRGPGLGVGYFRCKEETDAVFDAEGWFHTGDIAIMHMKTLAIAIIDRKKNIFKLSQGEYVAPEKIEAVYSLAPLVAQIFVFGYSDQASLVAIVVVDPDVAAKWASQHNCADMSLEVLCQQLGFQQAVMRDMDASAKANNLKGFERVREIFVTHDPFTVDNNLLTPTSKVRRADCAKRYKNEINEMYEKMVK